MFFSRFQLQEAMQALDLAQQTSPCNKPRRTDVQERWNESGEFELGPVPEPTYLTQEVGPGESRFMLRNGVQVRTNADLRPDPHGRAFLTVDPKTLDIVCAACAASKKKGAK